MRRSNELGGRIFFSLAAADIRNMPQQAWPSVCAHECEAPYVLSWALLSTIIIIKNPQNNIIKYLGPYSILLDLRDSGDS